MKKVLIKSAVATAVTAIFAANVQAATLDFTAAADGTIVLANEIFGIDEGSGSEETLITSDSYTFTINDATSANTGDIFDADATDFATIKFTLNKGAVFGEDLSTTAKVQAANGNLGALICSEALNGGAAVADDLGTDNECGATATTADNIAWEVVQGGAIGDNTITFRFTARDIAVFNALSDITLRGVKIKNLTSALSPASSDPRVSMGVEYVEAVDAGVDDVNVTATDDPLVIFGSQAGVELTVENAALNDKARINVADDEKDFTSTKPGTTDFTVDPTNTTQAIGLVTLSIADIDTVAFPGADAGKVKKENGDDFDFQAGDNHELVIEGVTGRLAAFDGAAGGVFLDVADSALIANIDTEDCTDGAPDLTGDAGDAVNGVVTLSLSGTTTALTTTYAVCVDANGTDVIPEEDAITVDWNIEYFNPRYDWDALSDEDLGPLLRNGCIASIFNVPSSTNAVDTAFIRLTNTSDSIGGAVRATVYAQDGSVLAEQQDLTAELDPHATAVYTSAAADVGSAISIPALLGVDAAAGTRARVVLTGAFPTCEALGLIRNASTGILTNMTATTQGNETRGGDNAGNNGN